MPRNHNTAAAELVIVEPAATATTLDQHPAPAPRLTAADAGTPVLPRGAAPIPRGSGS